LLNDQLVDSAYPNLSEKCLRNNLLLYDLNYRFHKAATPMYTSMLTTDAAAARDGINAGLAAEYGPGAGPPAPGARYKEEAGEGEVAAGAGAGAGTEVRANTAGSNTRITIITIANPLLDITLFSF
jgi:hypothetical protein